MGLGFHSLKRIKILLYQHACWDCFCESGGVMSRGLVFLKSLAFCCIMSVVLVFAYAGVKRFDLPVQVFLLGAVLVVLFKLSLDLLIKRILGLRGQSLVIVRVFLFLRSLALTCLLSFILGLALIGAKYLGVPWIWSLNEWASIYICVFLVRVMSIFFHEETRCVGVTLGGFLKRMGILLNRGRFL